MNEVLQGDCLDVLNRIAPNSVDLVYLDPPFFTQKEQRLQTRDGLKEYGFEDAWENRTDYRNYISKRLDQCRRILKDTGSLFLHCDRSASHHLRLSLDEVFEAENFQSEIIWYYRRWSNSKKGLLNAHQILFFYSKTHFFKFNPIYQGYSPTTNIDQNLQERVRDERGKSVYKTGIDGKSILMKDKKGVPLSDVWEIPYLNPKAKERVGYPTQKPLLLLERVIQLVTTEGDVVLDPFAGSGTTLVAAKLLNRKFIGIDQSKDAVILAKQRLAKPIKSESALLKKGLETYKNQDTETELILKRIGAIVVQRNKGIDGFIRTLDGLIPIKIKKKEESFHEAKARLLKASQKNHYPKKVLLLFHESQAEPELMNPAQHPSDRSVLVFNSPDELIHSLNLYR
jgi:site-specific DNA-methyltransferase (adenine-specific)